MTYDKIDIEKLEKSAYDTYNVCALMGCLVRAIHDQIGDSRDTEEETFCWQLKGAIQMAYDILDEATFTFFEVLEIADHLQKRSVVKGQGEADTP